MSIYVYNNAITTVNSAYINNSSLQRVYKGKDLVWDFKPVDYAEVSQSRQWGETNFSIVSGVALDSKGYFYVDFVKDVGFTEEDKQYPHYNISCDGRIIRPGYMNAFGDGSWGIKTTASKFYFNSNISRWFEYGLGGPIFNRVDKIMKITYKKSISDSGEITYTPVYGEMNKEESEHCFDRVIDMSGFFAGQKILTGEPVCGINTVNMCNAYSGTNVNGHAACGPKVTDISKAYIGTNVVYANCGINVVNMYNCYDYCNNLILPACGPNVVDFSRAFSRCKNLQLFVCGPSVENMYRSYWRCYNVTAMPVCGDSVVNFAEAYTDCNCITGSPAVGKNVVNMCNAYRYCKNLTGSPICRDNVIDMSYAYANSGVSGTAVFGNNVHNARGAYLGCKNITSVSTIPKSLYDLSLAFSYCSLGGDIWFPDVTEGCVIKNAFGGRNSKSPLLVLHANKGSSWYQAILGMKPWAKYYEPDKNGVPGNGISPDRIFFADYEYNG